MLLCKSAQWRLNKAHKHMHKHTHMSGDLDYDCVCVVHSYDIMESEFCACKLIVSCE